LLDRIARVDPGFRPEQLEEVAARIRRDIAREQREARAAEQAAARQPAPASLDPGGLLREIGNPAWERLLVAATIAASLPDMVRRGARSPAWASEVLLLSLLHEDAELRERQLLVIARLLGSDSETRVRSLLQAAPRLQPEQRLPLLEIALPAVKQRSSEQQTRLLETVREVSRVDGEVEVFEYLLARLISQYLWEAANPRRAARPGRRTLVSLGNHAATVLAILARHGHAERGSAERAYAAGLAKLGLPGPTGLPEPGDWSRELDRALQALDGLRPEGRQTLVEAMLATAMADERVVASELELMRAVCAALHVPVPALAQPAAAAD
jgi:uncharacterized tellurite resistance protein B-like protein